MRLNLFKFQNKNNMQWLCYTLVNLKNKKPTVEYLFRGVSKYAIFTSYAMVYFEKWCVYLISDYHHRWRLLFFVHNSQCACSNKLHFNVYRGKSARKGNKFNLIYLWCKRYIIGYRNYYIIWLFDATESSFGAAWFLHTN